MADPDGPLTAASAPHGARAVEHADSASDGTVSVGSKLSQALVIGGSQRLFRVWDRVRRAAMVFNERRLSEWDAADQLQEVAALFASTGLVCLFFPPRQLKDFVRVERQLGAGAFGRVFSAQATPLGIERIPGVKAGTRYAVKEGALSQIEPFEYSCMTLQRERLEEFVQAFLAKETDDANVARLFMFMMEPARDRYYEIMEYLEGPDLFHYLAARESAVPEARAAAFMAQVLKAVAHLHTKIGMVHRDLKPENLAFSRPIVLGEPLPPLKVFDFGLSWILEKPATGERARELFKLARAGTPAYMAPENWLDRCGPPSDLWAVGIIAFAILSLDLPFGLTRCQGPSSIRVALQRPVEWRQGSEPSACVVDFVSSALTRARATRATAEELLQHRWLQEGAVPGGPEAPVRPAGPGRGATMSFTRSRAEGRHSVCAGMEGRSMAATAVLPTPGAGEEDLLG